MQQLIEQILGWTAGTLPYRLVLGFVAAYPIITGVMWTLTSLIFYRRNERDPLRPPADDELPFVSVVVAAYCEEAVIARTLESLLALDYPR
jgi:cellulose synthase/poly-beta-1,6-N-acetylglucosamine synthase-like glycosyltransferase